MTNKLLKIAIITIISIGCTILVLNVAKKKNIIVPQSTQLPDSKTGSNLEIIDYKISIE